MAWIELSPHLTSSKNRSTIAAESAENAITKPCGQVIFCLVTKIPVPIMVLTQELPIPLAPVFYLSYYISKMKGKKRGKTGNVFLVRQSKVRNINQQLACLLSLLISQACSVVWMYLSNTAWEESYLEHCALWKLWPHEKGLVATLFHHPDTPYLQALPSQLILGGLMVTFWIWKSIFSTLQSNCFDRTIFHSQKFQSWWIWWF